MTGKPDDDEDRRIERFLAEQQGLPPSLMGEGEEKYMDDELGDLSDGSMLEEDEDEGAEDSASEAAAARTEKGHEPSDEDEDEDGDEDEDDEGDEDEDRTPEAAGASSSAAVTSNEMRDASDEGEEDEEDEDEEEGVPGTGSARTEEELWARARVRALRATPLVAALAQLRRLRDVLPALSPAEVAARAPALARCLPALVLGWSAEGGVLLRASVRERNVFDLLEDLQNRADELLSAEGDDDKDEAAEGANETEMDKEMREREMEEEDKLASEVSAFLGEEAPPPKRDRAHYGEAQARTAPAPVADDRELAHFFLDRAQQRRREELAQAHKQQREREALVHPLFRTRAYRPPPLDFDAGATEHRTPADGTFPPLHAFVANTRLQVHGVSDPGADAGVEAPFRCSSCGGGSGSGNDDENKGKTVETESESESNSTNSSSNNNRTLKAAQKVDEMLEAMEGVDLLDWEEDIVWDSEPARRRRPERAHKRSEDDRYFVPPDDYVNPQLESGEWVRSISWDGDQRGESIKPHSAPVIYDLNDPNIFFQIEDEDDEEGEDEQKGGSNDGTKTARTKKGKDKKQQQHEEGEEEEEEFGGTMHVATEGALTKKEAYVSATGEVDALADTTYNVSYDYAYAKKPRVRKMKQRAGLTTVNHGVPAITLAVFPTHMTNNDRRSFHRPKYVPPEKVRGVAQGVALGLSAGDLRPLAKHPKRLKHLSAMTGDILLVEHLEKDPALVSYVAMGSQLRTYYRKAREDDLVLPADVRVEGELVLLDPGDTSPFAPLGEVGAGCAVHVLENKMTKMPVARHAAAETDFLLVQATDGRWSVRELGPVFLAGQEFPQMEVPVPGSNAEKNKLRLWVVASMTRTFRNSRPHVMYRTQDFRDAFDQIHDNTIRELLKRYCIRGSGVAGTSSTYEVNPHAPFPTEEEIARIISPEELCAYNAMQRGAFMLGEEGITRVFYPEKIQELLSAEKDPATRQYLEQFNSVLSVAPWVTTAAYLDYTNGKDAITVFGPGAPLVRAEGFSFAPPPGRALRRESEPPRQKRSQVAGTKQDLRSMSKGSAIEELVVRWGYSEEELAGKRRKELVDMVKARANEDGDSEYARAVVPRNEKNRQKQIECHQLFERMLLAIAQDEPPGTGPEIDPDSFLRELDIATETPSGVGGGACGVGATAGAGASAVTSPSPWMGTGTPQPGTPQQPGTPLPGTPQLPGGDAAAATAGLPSFSSVGARARHMTFRGATRNPLIRTHKAVAKTQNTSLYQGNRWHPDSAIVPLVSMPKKIPIKRGRPRKHPLPEPDEGGSGSGSGTTQTTTSAASAGPTGVATASTATAAATATTGGETVVAPGSSDSGTTGATTGATTAAGTTPTTVKQHHHRRHKEGEEGSSSNSNNGGEPPTKKAKVERGHGRKGKRTSETAGVTIDGVVYPAGTPRPTVAALLQRLAGDPGLAWSAALADDVAALAPLDGAALADVCRRRWATAAADPLYELCWSLAPDDMRRAQEDVAAALAKGSVRPAPHALRLLFVGTRPHLSLRLVSAPSVEYSDVPAGAADVQPPLAEQEVAALEQALMKESSEQQQQQQQQRKHGHGHHKHTHTHAHTGEGGVRRAADSFDDIVVPGGAQPARQRARHATTCCDELEDALRSHYALPPRDDEDVTSFVVHIPSVSSTKRCAPVPQDKKSEVTAASAATTTATAVLAPCRVRLTTVPWLNGPAGPATSPAKAPAPATQATAKASPAPSLRLKISLAGAATPSTPATPATPATVLPLRISKITTAGAEGAATPAPRRSSRVSHQTERFADQQPLPPTHASSSGSSPGAGAARKKASPAGAKGRARPKTAPAPAPAPAPRKVTLVTSVPAKSKARDPDSSEDSSDSGASSSSSSSSSSDSHRRHRRHHHHHHHHHRHH